MRNRQSVCVSVCVFVSWLLCLVVTLLITCHIHAPRVFIIGVAQAITNLVILMFALIPMWTEFRHWLASRTKTFEHSVLEGLTWLVFIGVVMSVDTWDVWLVRNYNRFEQLHSC